MLYSYIKPHKKSPLTKEFMLLVAFFSTTIIVLGFTYIFLVFKDFYIDAKIDSLRDESKSLAIKIQDIGDQMDSIESKIYTANDINIKNSVMKDSISNLFDLVPNTITLSEAQILDNGLILYGTTPSKDIYNFMLQAPLRSIFNKTYVSFYPAQNGWLNFVSTSYLEDEERVGE